MCLFSAAPMLERAMPVAAQRVFLTSRFIQRLAEVVLLVSGPPRASHGSQAYRVAAGVLRGPPWPGASAATPNRACLYGFVHQPLEKPNEAFHPAQAGPKNHTHLCNRCLRAENRGTPRKRWIPEVHSP